MRNGQAYQRKAEKFSVSEEKSLVRLTPGYYIKETLVIRGDCVLKSQAYNEGVLFGQKNLFFKFKSY